MEHHHNTRSAAFLVSAMCLAEILNMIGIFAFPALLPEFITLWDLTNTQAGWISGIYFAGYTVSVPVLGGGLFDVRPQHLPRRLGGQIPATVQCGRFDSCHSHVGQCGRSGACSQIRAIARIAGHYVGLGHLRLHTRPALSRALSAFGRNLHGLFYVRARRFRDPAYSGHSVRTGSSARTDHGLSISDRLCRRICRAVGGRPCSGSDRERGKQLVMVGGVLLHGAGGGSGAAVCSIFGQAEPLPSGKGRMK